MARKGIIMIKGTCYTNLDNYQRTKWPTEFVEVPKIGSFIESDGGAVLRVVSITHARTTVRDYKNTDGPVLTHEPHIRIELRSQEPLRCRSQGS